MRKWLRQPHSSWVAAEADETTSFLHLPSHYHMPLWRCPKSAEQVWRRLWWKGSSKRANSSTHKERPVPAPGTVGRELCLRHSSTAFLLFQLQTKASEENSYGNSLSWPWVPLHTVLRRFSSSKRERTTVPTWTMGDLCARTLLGPACRVLYTETDVCKHLMLSFGRWVNRQSSSGWLRQRGPYRKGVLMALWCAHHNLPKSNSRYASTSCKKFWSHLDLLLKCWLLRVNKHKLFWWEKQLFRPVIMDF